MKNNKFIPAISFVSLVAATAAAIAAPPTEPSLSTYNPIIDKEPFAPLDTPPEPEVVAPVISARYELKGTTKMADGWLIVLSKTGETDTFFVRENEKNSEGVTIQQVIVDEANYLETKVALNTPTGSQTIGYNKNTIDQPIAPVATGDPGMPPNVTPGTENADPAALPPARPKLPPKDRTLYRSRFHRSQ